MYLPRHAVLCHKVTALAGNSSTQNSLKIRMSRVRYRKNERGHNREKWVNPLPR